MSGAFDELAALMCDIRHDTNNSLMAILGYLEILRGRTDLPEDVVAKLKCIETEAIKIRDRIARAGVIPRPGD